MLRDKGIVFSRTHLRRISDPASEWYQGFPLPIEVSPGRIAWDEAEVDLWISTRKRREPTSRSSEEEQDTVKLLPPPQGQLPDYSDQNIEE